jgi:phosphatidate cytidylyltransferase
MATEMTKRVAVAAIGIPAAAVVIYVGGWLLAVVLAAIAAAAAAELYQLAERRGVRAFVPAGVLLAAATVLLTAVRDGAAAAEWTLHLYVAVTLLAASLAIFRRGVGGAPLAAAAVTILGALFTGGTLSYAVLLRELHVPAAGAVAAAWAGPVLLFLPLVLTWSSDSAAYFGGRAWGRRRLAPAVSPGKTVAGAVSAVAGTVLVAAVYAHFLLAGWLGLPLGVGFGVAAGIIISVLGQLGDLAESLLKREAGVKDSGALLPGHGGVLDRFDSLFFTLPAAYWLVLLALWQRSAA